ncbi:MAG: alpha/beta hydrolase [Acidobacteria bacterium]|nr:alpha/beta hydrolase [Acidobacteriota bacterium]
MASRHTFKGGSHGRLFVASGFSRKISAAQTFFRLKAEATDRRELEHLPLARAPLLILLLVAIAAAPAAAATDVSLATADGVRLAGTFYQAARSAATPAPAVILLHMLTRSKADWDDVAERLASGGIHALAIDFRGHGNSRRPMPDEPLDLGRLPLDAEAARAWLLTRADVRRDRLGIAGASVGANVAVLVASGDPQIRSIALLSAGADYRGLRIDSAMRKYAERAALFIASREDPYASRSMRELSATGPGLRETRLLDGAGHGTVMLSRDRDLPAVLVDWFQKTLL